jgi:hypothetical protein
LKDFSLRVKPRMRLAQMYSYPVRTLKNSALPF